MKKTILLLGLLSVACSSATQTPSGGGASLCSGGGGGSPTSLSVPVPQDPGNCVPAVSLPGLPQVTFFDILRNPSPAECITVWLTTNEDLAEPPLAAYQYYAFDANLHLVQIASGSMESVPQFESDFRHWVLHFPNEGCDGQNTAARILVQATRLVDLDGNVRQPSSDPYVDTDMRRVFFAGRDF